ncbi:MAG: PAS domain S-box protein [Candidatus Omnitrophica bacterium]|nr:PAS domain S-box protein [Candidatus Omnitrophota bacterium]
MKYLMVISDNLSISQSIKILLKDYLVETTSSSQAIRKVKEREPFLVFIDTTLNETNPVELIEEILSINNEILIVPLVSTYDKNTREILQRDIFEVIEKSLLVEKIHYVVKNAEKLFEKLQRKKIDINFAKSEKHNNSEENFKDGIFRMVFQCIAENFFDTKKTCFEILKILRRYFHYNHLAIFLKEGHSFKIASSYGMEEELINELELKEEDPVIEYLMKKGKILKFDSIEIGVNFKSFLSLIKCKIIFPLRTFKGKLVGFLTIGEKELDEEIKSDEILFLSTITDYLSVVFDNFYLYKEIENQKRYQEFIFKNLPTGIIGVDKEGRINIMNEFAERILKVKFEELKGEKIEKIGSQIADLIRRAILYGETFTRKEFEFIPTKSILGMSTNIIDDENGNILGVVAIFQDLTKIKEIEKREKEIEKNKYWGLVASKLSHELKNPLVAINTFAQMLPIMYEDREFREEFSKIVLDEIKRINEIIESIGRIGKEFILEKEILKCEDLINELIKDKKVEIRKQKFRSGNVEVDILKLKEAIDFIFEFIEEDIKGLDEKIFIDIEESNSEVIITINESGKNIILEKDDISVPFFSKLNTVLITKILVAKKIIETHEGFFKIESLPSGKNFIIKLPLKNE